MIGTASGPLEAEPSLIDVGTMEIVLFVAGGLLTLVVLGFFVVVLWRSRKDR